MIRARRVARRFGDKRALEPVDFELERGGFLVLNRQSERRPGK